MALAKLNDYRAVVGDPEIEELKNIARNLKQARVKHVNSTAVGGGVAEILHRMVPLFGELNIDARWEVIKGGDDFFNITKAFHNALHGKKESISSEMYQVFEEYNRRNAQQMDFSQDDFVFIHDPQPICLIDRKAQTKGHWVWRCHIDISEPQADLWNFLNKYVARYSAAIISSPNFSQQLDIPQFIIPPSIDPLADKNKDLDPDFVDSVFEKYGIDMSRPLVTQISRFDYLKDPVGLITAFKMTSKKLDCQLVVAGGGATDDPEGLKVLEEVKAAAEGNPDIHILHLPPGADLEINALVRGSSIIVQNSIKEGFGLTVSEALWKGKALISRPVGGITQQVINETTGLLVNSTEGLAYAIRYLLANPDKAMSLGRTGREFVRDNFLITRHLRRYMMVMLSLKHPGQNVVYL